MPPQTHSADNKVTLFTQIPLAASSPALTCFGITLARGRVDLMPQRTAVVSDYKKQIVETPWIITNVRHSLSSCGYTSKITLGTHQVEGVDGRDEAGE